MEYEHVFKEFDTEEAAKEWAEDWKLQGCKNVNVDKKDDKWVASADCPLR